VNSDRVAPGRTSEPWSALVGVLLSALYLWVITWLALSVLLPVLILGWSPVAISSGSMEPTIRTGDVILASEPEHPLKPGQVITFVDAARSGQLVTHRIHSVDDSGAYRTKGDANASPDSTLVAPDDVVGRGRVLVPMAGLPRMWFDTQPGLLAVVAGTTAVTALVVMGPRRRSAEGPAEVVGTAV
jgi:signal peptidase I